MYPVVCLVPLFVLGALHGETPVLLAGRVTDENQAPVARARVLIQARGAQTIQETVTDAAGGFTLTLPVPGDYLVSVEREAFFRLENHTVRVAPGENELTLVLNHLREVFESLEVRSPPPILDHERTFASETLSGAEILAVPYPGTHSLRNALRVVPGIMRDQRGDLHLHGGAEEQVLYNLDGFNIGDPLTGRLETRLSVEAVRTVEIISGNPPAEFGKSSAGVLSLTTPTGDDRLRYSGTNFLPGIEHQKGLTVGGWTPRFNLSGPLRRSRVWFSDSLDIQYDQHVVKELPTGEDRTRSWRFGNLFRSQVNVTPSNILYTGFLVNYRNAPRQGLSFLDPIETTVDRRARQWVFHVKDQAYFGRGALLEAGFAANRTFSREVPQGQGLYLLAPEGRSGFYFLDAARKGGRDQWLANFFFPEFRLAGLHRLKSGIDLNRVSYWQDVRRTGFVHFRLDGTPLRHVVYGGSGLLSRANDELSVYVQDSWRMTPQLLLELGLRADRDRIVPGMALAPRFGFSWAPPPTEHTKISGGFAVLHDAVNLRLFTRPEDQHSIATYLDRDGSVTYGPSAALFRIEDTRLKRPRYQNWTLSMEQRVPGDFFVRAGWQRRRGRHGFTYAPASRPLPEGVGVIYLLGNDRRDVYDSFQVVVRRSFLLQYDWSAAYTRSRAYSNAVVDIYVDDPVIVTRNVGRMPWDAPNRVQSWGYLPTPRKNWALAYLLEYRTGYPFSIQDEQGALVGELNSYRFPDYFELNLHLERRFEFRGHRWALRGGSNNVTNHQNPSLVQNSMTSPRFLSFYGGHGRVSNFRIRWLGRAL